jgi:lipopolysaccharide export system protein LptC
MSAHGVRSDSAEPRRRARLIDAATARLRLVPAARVLDRRRVLIRLVKFALPAAAVGLLGAIALWPEFERVTERARISFRRIQAEIEGATMIEPRYRGVDDRARPYTVTAERARQASGDRIDLTAPKADITMEDGRWIMVRAKTGVYMREANQLDLAEDVQLYRDDGTLISTATVAIDLKAGVATGADPVRVEGSFGSIDAQGFTVTDKGAAVEFAGPASATLNGASR